MVKGVKIPFLSDIWILEAIEFNHLAVPLFVERFPISNIESAPPPRNTVEFLPTSLPKGRTLKPWIFSDVNGGAIPDKFDIVDGESLYFGVSITSYCEPVDSLNNIDWS